MKKNLKTILLSLVVMALWGSLYPMVKVGYRVFDISSASVPNILLFAGMRFSICGAVVCGYSLLRKEKLPEPKKNSILTILLIGLFSIVLHYTCTYIGLSTTAGSKTALIKQLGALIYVCFAFLFFKNERFSVLKIVAAIIGFTGIIAINYDPKGISFSAGDILIIGASFCTVAANVINKKSAGEISAFWVTGISQLAGGIVLLAASLIMGADMLRFDFYSGVVFAYICIASVSSYTLWYYILKTNSLSKMLIIKFAEPLFACVFGAVLLGENIFRLQYAVAFVLISLGIILGNKSEAKK